MINSALEARAERDPFSLATRSQWSSIRLLPLGTDFQCCGDRVFVEALWRHRHPASILAMYTTLKLKKEI